MITTSQIQALSRPQLDKALAAFGQPVTVKRPGQLDVQVRAFLYQLEEKSPQGLRIQAPEFRSVAWQGIFSHDAPIREPGYSVVDAASRVFVPEADAEDPGGQGVALIVRLSPAAERTRLTTLVFAPSTQALVRDPETGDMRPGPGEPLSVTARLIHTNDPHVVQLVGADSASTAIIGRWGSLTDPTGTPAGVRYGSQCPLSVDGQPGTLTVMLAWPDEDLTTEQQFGARWVGLWRVNKL